jgi:DNA-binding response OmpR family regulator
LTLMKQLRQEGFAKPIIFLTGKHEVQDKELALDSGADDYITKPFDVRELLARIRTIKRRIPPTAKQPIMVRGIEFVPQLRLVRRDQQQVRLTNTEGEILEFLMRHPDEYFSGADLFKELWGSDAEGASDQVVRTHIRSLRLKMAEIGAPMLVITVRGGGYIVRDATYKP